MPPRTYTKEADVKAEVKKLLTAAKWLWWMPPGNGFGKAGVADFNALRCGMFLAVETKFGRNKPTTQQIKYLRDVRANGGVAVVVCEQRLSDFAGLLNVLDAAMRIHRRPFDPQELEGTAPMQRMIQDYVK